MPLKCEYKIEEIKAGKERGKGKKKREKGKSSNNEPNWPE